MNLLKKLGFKIVGSSPKTKNGPDLWVSKNNRIYTVEIKTAKKQRGDNFQVRPVEKNRQKDDFIAIVFPCGYVLFEPMKHHLANCSKSGTRNMHGYG